MSDDTTGFSGKSTQELRDLLYSLGERVRECSDKIDNIMQVLAERAATVRVGDRVTWRGSTEVWEITAIRPGFGNDPAYFGKKIEKDGTPGARAVEMWRAHGKDWVIVEDSNAH